MNSHRSPSEVIKRGYSEEEIDSIYALARRCIENGFLRKAERILRGLTSVAPDYVPALLGLAYLSHYHSNVDSAVDYLRQALTYDSASVQGVLMLAVFLLSSGDINTAGTYLGEIREKIESGIITDSNIIRLYKSQVARFQVK